MATYTVDANDVPAGMARDIAAPSGTDSIKLISSGTPTVTVEEYVG